MPAANCGGDSSSDDLAYDNFGFGIFLHVAEAASPSSIAALAPRLYHVPRSLLRYTHELTRGRYYSGDDELCACFCCGICSRMTNLHSAPLALASLALVHYHAISRGVERASVL